MGIYNILFYFMMSFIYFIIGFIICICLNKMNFGPNTLYTNKWKRVYRILFNISIIILWPVYCTMLWIFGLIYLCNSFYKKIIRILK